MNESQEQSSRPAGLVAIPEFAEMLLLLLLLLGHACVLEEITVNGCSSD